MPKFKDRHGQDWEVTLTVAGLERVQSQVEFDLLNLLDDNLKGLAQLYDNPVQLVQIIYAICEPQIEAAGKTPEEFGECFAGESLRHAADAVVDATAAFYQSPKQGQILRTMKGKVAEGVNHHLRRLDELTDGVNEDEIKSAIDRQLGVTTESTAEATLG